MLKMSINSPVSKMMKRTLGGAPITGVSSESEAEDEEEDNDGGELTERAGTKTDLMGHQFFIEAKNPMGRQIDPYSNFNGAKTVRKHISVQRFSKVPYQPVSPLSNSTEHIPFSIIW